jgi:hypothetical protein
MFVEQIVYQRSDASYAALGANGDAQLVGGLVHLL